MSPKSKAKVIIFLFAGGMFALLHVGFDLAQGDDFNLMKFIFNFIFFGLLMAFIARPKLKGQKQQNQD